MMGFRRLGGFGRRQTGFPAPDFESAETALDNDAQIDFAHGLGVVPLFWIIALVCTTTDLNYSVGDEILMTSSYHGGGANDGGAVVFVDATNVSIVQGQSHDLLNRTDFNRASITQTSWRWVVKAWR
jgi:hypothetical protein